MMGRNRRYGKGRRADLKTRLGIATAVIVGGGAIGVAAVATTHHSASTATKAGYSFQSSSYGWNGASTISSALSSWSWNQSRSLNLPLGALGRYRNQGRDNQHGCRDRLDRQCHPGSADHGQQHGAGHELAGGTDGGAAAGGSGSGCDNGRRARG